MYDAAQILPKTIQDPTTWMGRMTKGAALGMRSQFALCRSPFIQQGR